MRNDERAVAVTDWFKAQGNNDMPEHIPADARIQDRPNMGR